MPKLIICRGIQGSGKSTWARKWAEEDPEHRVRFNYDDLRNMMGKYWVPTRENTSVLKALRHTFLFKMMDEGWDIVIDNMNLNPKDLEFYEDLVNRRNEDMETQYVLETQDFKTPLEECIRRDSLRPNPIGAGVITATYNRYKKFYGL